MPAIIIDEIRPIFFQAGVSFSIKRKANAFAGPETINQSKINAIHIANGS